MQGVFSDELKKLNGRFMEMGINISERIYQSTQSFTQYNQKLAQSVIDSDNQTNDEEVYLEKEALKLIVLQQPVATDFRKIISILKASSDLERIGDHTVNIAHEAMATSNQKNDIDIEKVILLMSNEIRKMLEMTLDAYIVDDDQSARKAAEKDLIIDKYYDDVREKLTKLIENKKISAERGSSYLMVVRLLERIGDHIVNLAEWVVYNKSGKIIELSLGKMKSRDL